MYKKPIFSNALRESSTKKECIFFGKNVVDKKNIKSNLIEIININEDFQIRSDEYINKLIDEVCDLKRPTIKLIGASKWDTKEIRSLLGVNGLSSKVFMNNIIKKLRGKIIDNAIPKVIENVEDDKSKMSSLSITNKYKNYSISNIGLSNVSINRITAYINANTLYDLLTYPLYMIAINLGPSVVKDIKNKIYELGLKFIDDLNIEEKQKIVSSSKKNVIDNSYSIWIDEKYKYREMNTIKDIMDKYNEHELFDENLLNYAYEIGIDFGQKEKDTYQILKNMTLEEKLNIDIKKIKMSSRLFNSLERAGVTKLNQIVSFTEKEILKFKNIGKVNVDELISILNEIGLSLKQEEVKEITVEDLKKEKLKLMVRKEILLRQLGKIDNKMYEVDQKILTLKNQKNKF